MKKSTSRTVPYAEAVRARDLLLSKYPDLAEDQGYFVKVDNLAMEIFQANPKMPAAQAMDIAGQNTRSVRIDDGRTRAIGEIIAARKKTKRNVRMVVSGGQRRSLGTHHLPKSWNQVNQGAAQPDGPRKTGCARCGLAWRGL